MQTIIDLIYDCQGDSITLIPTASVGANKFAPTLVGRVNRHATALANGQKANIRLASYASKQSQ